MKKVKFLYNLGKYLFYDTNKQVEECRKCPINTFSTGGALLINGKLKEWTDHNSRKFNSHCKLFKNSLDQLYDKNINCTKWEVNNERTFYKSGSSEVNRSYYTSELSYGTYLKKDGFIEFKYRKDTDNTSNGMLLFFVNYDMVLKDNSSSNIWKDYKLELKKGYHNFIWHYQKHIHLEKLNQELFAYISYIKVDGLEFAQTKCKKCRESKSDEGADSCIFCEANYFFNEENVKIYLNCIAIMRKMWRKFLFLSKFNW